MAVLKMNTLWQLNILVLKKRALLQNGQFQPSNLMGQEAFREN